MAGIYTIKDDRPTNWLRLVRGPSFVTPDGVTVQADKAWMDERIAEFQRLTSGGYAVPVITDHDPALTQQRALGDVLDMTTETVEGELELVAGVAWNDPMVPEAIRTKQLKYVSPGFNSFTDERGEAYYLVMSELSITAKPHRKGAATHILMTEAVMPDSIALPAPAPAPAPAAAPSVEERVASMETAITDLTASFAGIQTMLQELVATKVEEPEAEAAAELPMAEPAAPAVEPKVPSPEEIKMSERNTALERRLKETEVALAEAQRAQRRASFDLRYPAGAVIEMSEAQRDLFFTLAEAAPEAVNALTLMAVKPSEAQAPTGPQHRNQVQWGIAMGESAHTPTPPAAESDDALLARLVRETGSATKGLEAFTNLRPGR